MGPETAVARPRRRLTIQSIRRFGGLVALLAASAAVVSAPNPGSGELTESKLSLEYDGGPIAGPNPDATLNSECPNNSTNVENFNLTTTDLSPTFTLKHNLTVTLSPVASADAVLTLRDGTGATALKSSDGGGPGAGEAVSVPSTSGSTSYLIQVCLFAGSAAAYHVKAELTLVPDTSGTGPGPCDATAFGSADPTCVGNPRYQIFMPGPGADWANAAQGGAGEFNIGFNPQSGRIMVKNGFPIPRVTPAEIKPDGTNSPSGLPEACPELWEDATNVAEAAGLDPILWTDQPSGRTFESNSTAGAVGAFAYSDDDGATWIPVSASPPNGGVDHQTIGSGPLPASLAALATPQNHGQYVVYCSQDLVGANCQRSLTLGSSFENTAVPALGPGTNNAQGCGGLHGHLRAGPDGTMYITDKSCGSKQGGAFTTDTSTTPWTEFSDPFSTAEGSGDNSDPSIAVDADNTVYFCYINSEAGGRELHPHVSVGKRNGATINWLRDFDLGKSHGIVNAVFPEAWGGSAGRAACGFVGTNVSGSFQGTTFDGDWYAYIATTYDEGVHWTVVNATPNDPVQHHAGICLMGTGCDDTTAPRNLLDFNEMTVDDKGRALYGFSDGCVSDGCIAGTASNNNTAWVRVARQIGGRSLFESQDAGSDLNDGIDPASGPINPKPVEPKRPCLLDNALGHPGPSQRDSTTAYLRWRAPDNGGIPIVNYDVYRGTTAGGPYTLIGSTANAKPQYDDTSAGNTPDLYYVVKANTASLASQYSNEVKLQIGLVGGGDPCTLPGLRAINDVLSDGSDSDSGQNVPPEPGVNVKALYIAEPYLGPGTSQLVFQINVGPSTTGTAPANSEWFIIWDRKTVATDGSDRRYVAVRTDAAGVPSYEYGDFGPPLPLDGSIPPANANTPEPLGAADGGTFDAKAGTITITLSDSKLDQGGAAAGDALNNLNVRTFLGRNGQPGQRSQNNASDITLNAIYVLVGNLSCRPNNAPVIDSFTPEPEKGQSPLTVNFSAAAHDDDTDAPADNIAQWHIDFGDGQSADLTSFANVSHTYNSTSKVQGFIATLSVVDSRGKPGISSRTAEVEIDNSPVPQLAASPATVVKGSSVTLDASGSKAANNASVSQFTFDPADGSAPVTVTTKKIQHTYLRGGSFPASVSVTDSQGFESDQPATATVTVTDTAPVASLVADSAGGMAPVTVTFDGSGSYDPDEAQTTDHVTSYRFDWGDGTAPETTIAPSASHTFTAVGTYNVLLTVFDEEGKASASDALVQVEVLAPPPAGGNNTLGGALSGGLLTLLGLAGVARRVRAARGTAGRS